MAVDAAFAAATEFFNIESQRREARRVRAEAQRLASERFQAAREQREVVRDEQARLSAATRAGAGAAGVEGVGVSLAQVLNLEESIRDEANILASAERDATSILNEGRRQFRRLRTGRTRSLGSALGNLAAFAVSVQPLVSGHFASSGSEALSGLDFGSGGLGSSGGGRPGFQQTTPQNRRRNRSSPLFGGGTGLLG